jgi:hypothetical protein
MSLELIWEKIPVKRHKVDVDRIQDQFDRHENGDQVFPGQESVDADKKHQGADNKKIRQWNF